MDHMSHHAHYNHVMENSSDVTELINSTIPTTASTLIQAVMTTIMAHSVHHHHDSGDDSPSHSMNSNPLGPTSNPSSTLDHSLHFSNSHHSGHNVGNGNHMVMYFHSSVDAIILFKEWNVSTTQGLIGSVIGIFLMAMLYEGIKFFREYMFKKYFTSLEYSSVSVLGDDGKTVTEMHKVARNRMFSWPHMIQTVLHVVQMVLSYFLMLIFMTYNVWLCLGVVFGAGTGYFLFGWKKATVVDITEHCH